jgi:hypothetical protein
MQSVTGEEQNKTNGGQGIQWRSVLLGALVALTIAIGGPVIVGLIQAHQPELTYSAPDTIPFQGGSKKVAAYQVRIANEGRGVAEAVTIVITVPGAIIDQQLVSTSAPSIDYSSTPQKESVRVEVPTLNPAESLQISVLASGQDPLPAHPYVALRGKGTVGKEQSTPTSKHPFYDFLVLWVLSSAYVVIAIWLYLRPKIAGIKKSQETLKENIQSSREDIEKSKADLLAKTAELESSVSEFKKLLDEGLLEPRLTLAYLCRVHGLSDLADQYQHQTHPATYWAEADRLSDIAVNTEDEGLREKILALLAGLPNYVSDMGKNSRGIVCFDVARILISEGREDDAKRLIEMAIELCPEFASKRIKLDPLFSDKSWASAMAVSSAGGQPGADN